MERVTESVAHATMLSQEVGGGGPRGEGFHKQFRWLVREANFVVKDVAGPCYLRRAKRELRGRQGRTRESPDAIIVAFSTR